MEEKAPSRFHYFFRAAILLGFAMYIVFLVKDDNLIYYIAPHMEKYIKYSAVALYAVAVHQIYLGVQACFGSRRSCHCEHPPSRSFLGNTIVYSLFVFPLLLGFLMPNVAMSSALAEKKGMNLSANAATKKTGSTAAAVDTTGNAAPKQEPSAVNPNIGIASSEAKNPVASLSNEKAGTSADDELKKMFAPPDGFSEDLSAIGMMLYKKDMITVKPEIFMEVLSSIDLFKDRFIGKKIEMSGFVYRMEDLKPDQMVVGRFAVSCCAADASPYGVLVEFPHANNYNKDTWVKVTGTIEKGIYNDNEIFKIHANKIEKIEAPKSTYIYPNLDPVAELKKDMKN